MPGIHNRLLARLMLCSCLFLPSCAGTDSSASGAAAVVDDAEQLLIDLSAGTAVTAEWSANTADCSDQFYFCLSIPDRMVLAFPRLCEDASNDSAPPTAFGALRGVAPAPHLRPPSGSYIVEHFPRMLLFYYVESDLHVSGLFEVRELIWSPYEDEFQPSIYVGRYRVMTSDGSPLFECSFPQRP